MAVSNVTDNALVVDGPNLTYPRWLTESVIFRGPRSRGLGMDRCRGRRSALRSLALAMQGRNLGTRPIEAGDRRAEKRISNVRVALGRGQ